VLVSALVLVAAVGMALIPASALDLSQNIILGATPAGRPGHLLGTDRLGRDILALTLAGARSALVGPILIATGSMALGLLLGIPAGYFGGWFDAVVARFVDLTLSLPSLLLAIVVAGVTGGSYGVTIVLLVVLFSPWDIRVARSGVLQQRHLPYIEATRVLHLSRPRVLYHHLLPNLWALVITNVFLNLGYALVSLSSLSYLGLGVKPGQADWGRQLSDGRSVLYDNPAAAIVPAVAIILVASAANLVGDWLERRLSGDGEPPAAVTSAAPQTEFTVEHPSSDPPSPAPGHLTVSAASVECATGVLVHPVSFSVRPGTTLGIVGESGSGKTMLARSLVGILPAGVTATGRYRLGDAPADLAASEEFWGRWRGRHVVMVMQDPFTSLDPLRRVRDQIKDSLGSRRRGRSRKDLTAEVGARLAEVHLDLTVAAKYPHQLSGGMRQRVAIAAALACDPTLLIADEPTTALDVTTQREILDLLDELQLTRGMTVLLISHDLGLVRQRSDQVIVMKAGHVVERGPAAALFAEPRHPYTRALKAASPTLELATGATRPGTGPTTTLLSTVRLVKRFPGSAQAALDGVSIRVGAGESVGVVGESGSGKTTLARCLVGLEQASSGMIGYTPPGASATAARLGPRDIQIVFQDPYSTLNPALRIGKTLNEALAVAGDDRRYADAGELLRLVGLPAHYIRRRPARLSGGERQRVAIARALAPNPRILVCDESVSALDVSVQDRILKLLAEIRARLGLTLVFISHDLAVIAQVTDRVYVMREGKVVEEGPTAAVLRRPAHPYTQALKAAVPSGDKSAQVIAT
jgi:peptide/nickel transport system ATP-binding protein